MVCVRRAGLRTAPGRAVADVRDCQQNKNKQKKGTLPADMMEQGRYAAARTVGDEWICYPWEATDIDEHDELARKQKDNGTA